MAHVGHIVSARIEIVIHAPVTGIKNADSATLADWIFGKAALGFALCCPPLSNCGVQSALARLERSPGARYYRRAPALAPPPEYCSCERTYLRPDLFGHPSRPSPSGHRCVLSLRRFERGEQPVWAPPRTSNLKVPGPARKLFGDALPDFVLALDKWGTSEEARAGVGDEKLQELRGTLMVAMRKASFDTALTKAFEDCVDAAIYTAKVEGPELDDAALALVRATMELNDAIASAGLGFFVDVDLQTRGSRRRFVLLMSFEVSRVVLYRSSGHDVRTPSCT